MEMSSVLRTKRLHMSGDGLKGFLMNKDYSWETRGERKVARQKTGL